jgi:leucyl-tRNA synthetase
MFFNNTEIKIVDDIKLIDQKLNIAFNKFIKNVDTHLDEFKHNLAVSDMMIFFNECNIYKNIYKEHVKGFLTILSFFAPHLAEELYSHIFKTNKSIVGEEFPKYDDKIISLATFNLPIQVNGKLRATIEVEKTISESEAIELSFGNENVLKYVPDRKYKKVIFVNGKIINFIV